MDIPVTILGGYLGAGKTTLLNHVLSHARGRHIAVLVNDFGAINIDASLIASRAEDMIALSNGCVCCTIEDDLGAAIEAQLKRNPPPQHILIEASGVAESARMLRYVESWPGLKRNAVVCVADVESIRQRASDKFVGSVVRRQLSAADLVILNKTDLADAEAVASVSAWLEKHAPDAASIPAMRGQVAPELLFEWAETHDALRANEHPHAEPVPFFNTTIPLSQPVDLASLEAILSDLPASVHRIKGFVADRVGGDTLLVQCVGSRCTIESYPQLSPAPPTVLVAIGTDRGGLDALRKKLWKLTTRESATLNGSLSSAKRDATHAAASDPGSP